MIAHCHCNVGVVVFVVLVRVECNSRCFQRSCTQRKFRLSCHRLTSSNWGKQSMGQNSRSRNAHNLSDPRAPSQSPAISDWIGAISSDSKPVVPGLLASTDVPFARQYHTTFEAHHSPAPFRGAITTARHVSAGSATDQDHARLTRHYPSRLSRAA